MPATNTVIDTNNVMNNPGDVQQQARKANGAQSLPQNGKPVSIQTPVWGDIRVTLSDAGRSAAAVEQGKAVASNEQAVEQPVATQNAETANAIRAYQNATQVADNAKQNPQTGQTQKAISRLGGTA